MYASSVLSSRLSASHIHCINTRHVRGSCPPALRSTFPAYRHWHCVERCHAVSNTDYSAVTEPGGPASEAADVSTPSGNGSNSASTSQQEGDSQTTWGLSPAPEEDWQGIKPLTWKDVDWGLTALMGVILFLSFGAYRVLDHFSIYQRASRPASPQMTTVVERPASSSSSSSPSSSKTKASKSKHKQEKAGSSKASGSSGSAAAVAAAAGAEAATAPFGADNSAPSAAAEADPAAGTSAVPSAAGAAGPSGFEMGTAPPSFDLPPAGIPGAPQPSPLDAGFSSMPTPWAGTDLGQLDFAPLPLPEGLSQPPELPSVQVAPPAKTVSPADLAAMPTDPSLPSLRERAHIAMRASGAAVEASQRAAAYSAAASSAASRAAESAEQAAAAASAVQSALEAAAEDAMAEAVKRMNRAVEMVADAESRAAAAAAMATAYQDISDSQAAAANTAADLPAMPARQVPQGHIANLQKVLHEQMFSAGGVLTDWVTSVWAALVGALAWVQAALAGAWGKIVGA